MEKRKRKTEDQILIRSILGIDKFLMLNLKLVKLVGLNEAVVLTYILDKIEHTLSWDKYVIDNGIIVFRKDIEGRFGLSDYQQRKLERNLTDIGILNVIPTFDGLNTYNLYVIHLEALVSKLNELTTELPPLKN
jgi:hypothetical protein